MKLLRNMAIGWLVAVAINLVILGLLIFGFEEFVFIVGMVLLAMAFCLITSLAITILVMPDFPE